MKVSAPQPIENSGAYPTITSIIQDSAVSVETLSGNSRFCKLYFSAYKFAFAMYDKQIVQVCEAAMKNSSNTAGITETRCTFLCNIKKY